MSAWRFDGLGLTECGGWHHVDYTPARLATCVRPVDVGELYDDCHMMGLMYGPAYRTLEQTWGDDRAAMARLHLRSTWEGTQVHPADLDDAIVLALTRQMPSGSGETSVPFAVDDVRLEGNVRLLPSCELWAVRATHCNARAHARRECC